MSEFNQLNEKDIIKGLVTAVLSAVIVAIAGSLQQMFAQAGFDVFAANWPQILNDMLKLAINVAGGTFLGYITKNFFSNSEGKFLGKI